MSTRHLGAVVTKMHRQEHPTPPGALVARLPFAQGDVTACAHISVAVTSILLRNPTTALIPPLVVDQAAIKRGTTRGLNFYLMMLAERRRATPDDKSAYFSPGDAVYDYKKRLAAQSKVPWFEDRHESGYIALRARVPNEHDTATNASQGCMPRLVDELARAHHRATVDRKAQGIIMTCGAYTRSLIFREDGQWVYDSHGLACSALYYFSTLDAMATYLLRACGVLDDAQIAENLDQMHQPELRVPDCDFDATVRAGVEFEIVVIECCDTDDNATTATAAMEADQ